MESAGNETGAELSNRLVSKHMSSKSVKYLFSTFVSSTHLCLDILDREATYTLPYLILNINVSESISRNLRVPVTALKMVQISEVKGNSRENRTAAHTHIRGLGLRGDGYAETTGAGFVGQVDAREVRLY